MSLPATDDFNRGDANPIGGNWTTVTGQGDVAIVSNQAVGGNGGGGAVARWNADTFSDDQYCQAKIQTIDGASLLTRVPSSAFDGYLLYMAGSGDVRIYRMDAGSAIGPLSTPNFAYVVGDTVKLTSVGSTHTAYKNGVAQANPATDATHTSGSPGINFNNSSSALDDWEGGNVSSTTPIAGADTDALVLAEAAVPTAKFVVMEP